MSNAPLLRVEHLTVVFDGRSGAAPVLHDVTFEIQQGETLGLVGASGGGKSMLARSILRLLPPAARIVSGSIVWRGRDLVPLPEREMQRLRGAQIGLVVQEPLTALNPVLTIGQQIEETLRVHGRADAERATAIDLLSKVRLADPVRRLTAYPHELSGGERQRVVLALALGARPSLLIADEPTTALDVLTQADILDLLRTLARELDLALLLISHDLAVVAEHADRIAVMHEGTIVEQGQGAQVLREPKHAYTKEIVKLECEDLRI